MSAQTAPRVSRGRAPFVRRNIAAKVRDTSDLYVKLMRARVRPHGLSLNQFRLLREVWEDEGVAQRVISERMRVSEPATVNTIDALVQAGLVRRMRTQDDKRRSLVFLTADGRRLRDRILEINATLNSAALKGLDRDEVVMLGALLDRISHNLLALGEASPR